MLDSSHSRELTPPPGNRERKGLCMAVDWLVTFSAIESYLQKAQKAQDEFNEATETMKSAAAELSSRWEGDAATAFAEEQAKMNGWCLSLLRIAAHYMTEVKNAVAKYKEAEQAVRNTIGR